MSKKEGDHWKIDKIIAERIFKNDQEFLVQWSPSWVKASEIDAQDEIVAFFKGQAQEKAKENQMLEPVGAVTAKRNTIRRSQSGVSWFAEDTEMTKKRAQSLGRQVQFLTPSPQGRNVPSARGRTTKRDQKQQLKAQTSTSQSAAKAVMVAQVGPEVKKTGAKLTKPKKATVLKKK